MYSAIREQHYIHPALNDKGKAAHLCGEAENDIEIVAAPSFPVRKGNISEWF